MLIFAGESISLRLAAKANLSTGLIAFAQCTMAAIIQLFFGGRFSKVNWKGWWLALTLSALSGLSFYLAIRLAPVALVGLIEPLSLLPLMFAHRFIQERKLTAKSLISLVLLVIASCATVGQWPEKLSFLAIFISCIGIASTGLSLVAGEVVKKDEIPSFVLAMQTVLAILSASLVIFLGNSSLGGQSNNWIGSLAVGAVVGLIVSLAVSALYYGMQHLGALRAGTIKILRLPVVALFGYILINEKGNIESATALIMVVIFSILTIRFSSNTSIRASIKPSLN